MRAEAELTNLRAVMLRLQFGPDNLSDIDSGQTLSIVMISYTADNGSRANNPQCG